MIEQRLGESDAEYEARKRRIKLLRYVGNNMFAHAGGGGGGGSTRKNFCITQGSDGTLYGATLEAPGFGVIDPNTTVLGQTIYAITWDALGNFELRLGDLGNEPAPDVTIAILTLLDTKVSLIWDPDVLELRYKGTNLDLATRLIAQYVEGEEICGYLQVIPNLFISYNFTLLRGTA